ncbi:neuronal acetylcholine receptor subunit beta-2-like [Convolutriloba macropyga]|uniref:neuronal acetylcholine receptor subunit beta-2-like n=1 Tax=Convolutriloba macropyga TaxID=536237 RepID=UPI003F524816
MRVWICINYTIPELAWDPADFDNVSLVYLPPGSVWTPDIELVDVSAIDYRGFKGQALWWDGTVTARSSMVTLKISCQLQFLNFPFDSQECPITAAQWLSDTSRYRVEGQLGLVGEGSNLALLQGQWELQMPMTYNVFPMPNYESYDIIQFTFRFKRNPEFYLIVLVVPSVLLGILPTLAFLIPVESGEKISLGLTTLLAQVVELLVLSDILPPSSRGDFPILGRLVIYSIVLIAVAILESIFVTCIYHVDPKTSLPWFTKCTASLLASTKALRSASADEEDATG